MGFTGTRTPAPLGGVGIDVLAEEVAMCATAGPTREPHRAGAPMLETGGNYQWRREERGAPVPTGSRTVFLLRHHGPGSTTSSKYTQSVDQLSEEAATLRGLFTIKNGERPPVPLDEVEPVSEIVEAVRTPAR